MIRTLSFIADRGFPGGGMRHDGSRWWGLAVFIAVIAAAVAITWLLARNRPALGTVGAVGAVGGVGAAPAPSPTASAEAILAERLARSEITPDEYRNLLQALQGGATPAATPAPPAPPAP